MKKKKNYRKLSKNFFSLFYTNSLWQGPDHLLRVEAGMMTEGYNRFYYNDIQAVVLRRTARFLVWNLILGALVIIGGLSISINLLPIPFSATLTIIFLLLFLLNLILGPTCKVYLQTAVQVQKLPAIIRQRRGLKVMDRIREAVENIQGPVHKIETSSIPVEGSNSISIDGQLAFHQIPGQKAIVKRTVSSVKPFNPLLHRLLFVFLLAGGICGGFQLWLSYPPLVVTNLMFLIISLILVISTLGRWHENIKGRPLEKITWGILALIVLQIITTYAAYIITTLHNPKLAYDNWALFSLFLHYLLNHNPFNVVQGLLFNIGKPTLGILGFFALHSMITYGEDYIGSESISK